jgi:hypothetical protein
MRALPLAIVQLMILLSCRNIDNQEVRIRESVKTPTNLAEYSSQDSVVRKTINRIKDHLAQSEPNDQITDFFVDKVERRLDTVVVYVNHIDYYLERDKVDREFARIDSLQRQGADSLIGIIYVPPTGNWSGKDRMIVYLTKGDTLIDLLVQ